MSGVDPRLLNDCVFVPFSALPVQPAPRRARHIATDLPGVARARHMRRELERAAEHGAALLIALRLPRLVDEAFTRVDREALSDALDTIVAHLDDLDAPEDDFEEDTDLEKTGDEELDLGWPAAHSQIKLGTNTEDGDLSAPERHGRGFMRCGPDDFELSEEGA